MGKFSQNTEQTFRRKNHEFETLFLEIITWEPTMARLSWKVCVHFGGRDTILKEKAVQ